MAYEHTSGALAVGTSRGMIKVFLGHGAEILLHDAAQTLRGMAAAESLQVPVQHLLWLPGGLHLLAVFRNSALQVWSLASRALVGSLDSTWAMSGIRAAAVHPSPPGAPAAYAYLGGDNGIVYGNARRHHCRSSCPPRSARLVPILGGLAAARGPLTLPLSLSICKWSSSSPRSVRARGTWSTGPTASGMVSGSSTRATRATKKWWRSLCRPPRCGLIIPCANVSI